MLYLLSRLIQLELEGLGISTAYKQQRVAELGDEVWQGVRNKYWHFPVYFLPVCRKSAAAAGGDGEEGAAGGGEGEDGAAAAAAEGVEVMAANGS